MRHFTRIHFNSLKIVSYGPSLPACDFCLQEIFENQSFLFTVTLIVLLDLFIHPNQGTSFIIYLLKFHLLPTELYLLMPERFAENRSQIKNRTLVRMGHYPCIVFLQSFDVLCDVRVTDLVTECVQFIDGPLLRLLIHPIQGG